MEGQPVVPAEWLVIKGSWAAAVEKATHQPLTGLDDTDGNLWFFFAGVRARCAASSRTLTPGSAAAAARATDWRRSHVHNHLSGSLWWYYIYSPGKRRLRAKQQRRSRRKTQKIEIASLSRPKQKVNRFYVIVLRADPVDLFEQAQSSSPGQTLNNFLCTCWIYLPYLSHFICIL